MMLQGRWIAPHNDIKPRLLKLLDRSFIGGVG